MYRPFFSQRTYLDSVLNSRRYQLQKVFPEPDVYVPCIVVTGGIVSVIATQLIPNIKLPAGSSGGIARVLPRYVYDSPPDDAQTSLLPSRRDNITGAALAAYQVRYGDAVNKDHVFAYVYGILHSPDYRERYATDLAKMLPRIPEVASADDFFAFAEAGHRLLDLHIGYQEAEPYPLHEQVAIGAPDGDARWYVEKMKWAGDRKQPDRSTIIVNDWVTISGIPDGAHRYVVGPRTALEWLIDRYRIKTDKASGIVNDVNDWGLELDPPNPRYIIDLIKRVTTVSVETMKIVDNLPPLREAE